MAAYSKSLVQAHMTP